ncbi:MAG: protein translocase subunit SecD [Pseudomonadota bacterium]
MLHFPPWKVAIVASILFLGCLLALPNLFADTTLGKTPLTPINATAQEMQEYNAKVAAAEASNWPGFIPSSKVNLGLDLRGGVYLLIELAREDVVGNRLENFATEATTAFNTRPVVARELPIINKEFVRFNLLDDSQMDLALDRLRDLNQPIASATGGVGGRLFRIEQSGSSGIEVRLVPGQVSALVKDAQIKSMEVVRRRVDPDGVAEISIQPSQDSRLILEAPGEPDPERIKSILSQAGNMTFNLINENPSDMESARAGRVPRGHKLLREKDTGFEYLVIDTPIVRGSDIASASLGYDESNRPQVNFSLGPRGAKRFGDATLNNPGRLFAIVLDGTIMSAPRINDPIYGGNVRITGTFTVEEAEDLAAIIEAGELPAKLRFINERTVGPTLGEASIQAGTAASLIGLALVAIFMIIAYGLLGGFAVASLVFNIVLILGALSGLGATLTLPGIAGIVLTIGMAVDANVLVFERIREEKRNGRSPMTAVQAGYERALSTILDANITTFIAAAILYMLGSGPVKGFAVTLAVGIVTSVFTAFVVTRWFTVIWLKAAKPKTLAV